MGPGSGPALGLEFCHLKSCLGPDRGPAGTVVPAGPETAVPTATNVGAAAATRMMMMMMMSRLLLIRANGSSSPADSGVVAAGR